jgi:hypothetical protein
MIKIKRDIETIYRKEEKEDGVYSMPITNYKYSIKLLGINIINRNYKDSSSLKIEKKFKTIKEERKAGY